MKNALAFSFLLCLLACCEHENLKPEEVVDDSELNQTIPGSWLQVEYGYSPGDKYQTVPVSPNPPQTITFKSDFTMSSKNMRLDSYKYYRLLEDAVADRQVIAFFEEDPGNEPLALATLSPTYFIFWEGNYLYLNYRWCIEGCHMKFKRISSEETD